MRTQMGRTARREAEKHFDWATELDRAAQRINSLLRYRRRMSPPFFSVVIPTYNRPDNLLRNLEALTRQTFPDFEVVVVDQSDPAVGIPEEFKQKLAIRYVYSQQRGQRSRVTREFAKLPVMSSRSPTTTASLKRTGWRRLRVISTGALSRGWRDAFAARKLAIQSTAPCRTWTLKASAS